MKKINKDEAIEMLFECLFTDYYTDSLSQYEKEKVYVEALDYQYQLFKPKLDYWKKRNKGDSSINNIPEVEDKDLYERVNALIAKLQPIVGSKNNMDNILSPYSTHEKLFEALIFSANEELNKPIEGAYDLLKKVWFFVNSDNATFNGKDVGKYKRPLFVNPVIIGKPEFDKFFEAEITYCSTQNKIQLTESDFNIVIGNWIERRRENNIYSIPQKRKFEEFLEYIKRKSLPTNQSETKLKIYRAKHYVLTYILECHAMGISIPASKNELERIGNERIGKGKGNTFYKNYNEIGRKDLNVEKNLIEIGGENWRDAVIRLSKAPELVEKYLQSKQL